MEMISFNSKIKAILTTFKDNNKTISIITISKEISQIILIIQTIFREISLIILAIQTISRETNRLIWAIFKETRIIWTISKEINQLILIILVHFKDINSKWDFKVSDQLYIFNMSFRLISII